MNSALIVGTTIAWVAVVLMTANGLWFPSLFLLTGMIILYVALGTSRRGQLDLGLLMIMVGPWAVAWAIGFALAEHYAARFAGTAPDFTVAGLHPSYAMMVGFYWIASSAAITFAFFRFRDRWLSPEEWAAFERDVAENGEEP
ncbi:MAG: hypothetical protein AAFU77_16915 [Myxococcota bacterium]